ncbi:hypothetical protein [Bacillus thuringiensis]|uniref:hypothetical protein n=1 Tax=Bacillus thuringiensis TaxID=1428 RepID=UPI001F0AA953|nr:hypothetical protein [Bacillus thuringiensis]
MGPKWLVDEKTIRPYVIEALQDYLRYIQIKRTLEEAFDEDRKSILEMKSMNIKLLNDDYIYHFSQEDSFLEEREVSRWEMNWLRTRDGRELS